MPDKVYPWVFPLWVEQPRQVFAALKRGAVPVLRFGEFLWPDAAAAVCDASVELSRHVMQFPCHQELREAELEWLIVQIRAALASGAQA